MKKSLYLIAALVLCSSAVALAVPRTETPVHFVTTIDTFGGGTQEEVGNLLLIRNLVVEATITGDFVGSDVHIYNNNLNLTTFKGHTWGTISMQLTSPCVGAFDGFFHGKSKDGAFPDEDKGDVVAFGSGGCEGKKVKGSITEPSDGVFDFIGVVIDHDND